MGTFTIPYYLRSCFWDKRGKWALTVVAAYLCVCYHDREIARYSMMKGQTRLYQDWAKRLPKDADPWK
ncbi:hypothetical protein WR25_02550, partial [Diploscapter pachys]